MSNQQNASFSDAPQPKLPWLALLALAAATFITILTETLPAGLLLPISADLHITNAMGGQLVTAYAIGSLIAAIPLSAATRAMRRRPLLMATIASFAVINLFTALSTSYFLTMIARFVAGMAAGLLWSIVAGYAARMVAPQLTGRAIAIAMVGTPLALSLGLPASTFLGELLSWRLVFGVMSLASLLLLAWVRWRMPDLPGQDVSAKLTLGRVLSLPGMRSILLTLFSMILAHNILYTYIAPIALPSGLGVGDLLSRLLLVFGIASLLSIVFVGTQVDVRLRQLTLIGTVLVLIASIIMSSYIDSGAALFLAVFVWGLGYGGSATLFQTATANTAGSDIDVAQAMTVVAWNLSISLGGIVGGLLLHFGPNALPLATVPLLVLAFVVVWRASSHGFSNPQRPSPS